MEENKKEITENTEEKTLQDKIKDKAIIFVILSVVAILTSIFLYLMYSSTSSKLNEAVSFINKQKNQIKNLQDKISNLETKIEERDLKISKLTDKIKQYEKQIAEKSDCEEALSEVQQKNIQLTNSLIELKDKLSTYEQIIKKYKENPLHKQVQALSKENKKLKEDLLACKKDKEEFSKISNYYKSIYKSFRKQYEQCKVYYKKLGKDFDNERKKTYFLDVFFNLKDKFKEYKITISDYNIIIKGYLDKETGVFYGEIESYNDFIKFLNYSKNNINKIQAIYKSPDKDKYWIVLSGV